MSKFELCQRHHCVYRNWKPVHNDFKLITLNERT